MSTAEVHTSDGSPKHLARCASDSSSHVQCDSAQVRPVIAVLIPCHNEEAAVAAVVRAFRTALPTSTIFVYDNNSTDSTRDAAEAAGAIVRVEPLQGKGNVVRRMFADVEADVFVLVDGDDTYDAASAPEMVNCLLTRNLDMVTGLRIATAQAAYRRGHRFGNAMLTGFVSAVFGSRQSDMLSGYRVLSRRFVKSFPALAAGFEIETELTVHALELRLPVAEVPTSYSERPEGSASKLRTYRDGVRILRTIFKLIKEEKPLEFFLGIFALLALSSVALAIPIITEFLETGLVPRIPTAVLSTGFMLLAFLSLTCGLILDTVTRGRIELKRLHYLSVPIRFMPVHDHVARTTQPSAPA
jgi:glycosyltransferase involved in cell wall biosynthesis